LVPDWQPGIQQPLDRIADRVRFYVDGTRDFVQFSHGTCVYVENGLTDQAASSKATQSLQKLLGSHPDFRPLRMRDGNVLVRYSDGVVNVVLAEVSEANWPDIEENHQQALLRDEVLLTAMGPNQFDDFAKLALFGRCFMFMDAQAPEVVHIERCSSTK
jgi:hypothetical protein